MSDQNRYELRGVSASKDEVHEAIKGIDKGLYPNAFCKILPDIVGHDEAYCNIMHADTAGTKTNLAYLYWRETGDIGVWSGIALDAIVMNLDDMACVGCIDDIVISSTIGRNKHLIPGEVIATIIKSTESFVEMLRDHNVQVFTSGGETADVGDVVRTIDVGITAFGRIKKKDVIEVDLSEGDAIVGLASYGQASYESGYNGGMGSNGLTSARHDVLSKHYAQNFPETYDSSIPDEVTYSGSKRLTDEIEVEGRTIKVGKLILSPTRTYMPVLKKILEKGRSGISGMIHCTGGAQTKVKKFSKEHQVIKDNLFDTPPLFSLIQKESGTSWKEMYQVFNMGHRLEIYCDSSQAEEIISISKSFNIDAQIIGRVGKKVDGGSVIIESSHGTYSY